MHEERCAFSATVIVVRAERMTERRLDAERAQEVVARGTGIDSNRLVAADQGVDELGVGNAERLEASRAADERVIGRARDRPVRLSLRALLEHAHETIRIWIRERTEDHPVRDAENGGIDADAERQRDDRRR